MDIRRLVTDSKSGGVEDEHRAENEPGEVVQPTVMEQHEVEDGKSLTDSVFRIAFNVLDKLEMDIRNRSNVFAVSGDEEKELCAASEGMDLAEGEQYQSDCPSTSAAETLGSFSRWKNRKGRSVRAVSNALSELHLPDERGTGSGSGGFDTTLGVCNEVTGRQHSKGNTELASRPMTGTNRNKASQSRGICKQRYAKKRTCRKADETGCNCAPGVRRRLCSAERLKNSSQTGYKGDSSEYPEQD